MPRKTLQLAGLSAPEADAYLACLKLGAQDLRSIAREMDLPSTEMKPLLERLLERGFLTRYTSGKRAYYAAEPPKALHRLLAPHRDRSRRDVRDTLGSLVPVLEALMRPGQERPDTAYYQGERGLRAAYEDTLTSATEIVAVASVDDTESILKAYMPAYYRRRKAAGIPIRAIFPDTPMARRRSAKDAGELRESRLLPESLFQVQIEWNVYDDKVAFFSLRERIAVIIRSRLIADAMRAAFEVHWRLAGMLDAEKRRGND